MPFSPFDKTQPANQQDKPNPTPPAPVRQAYNSFEAAVMAHDYDTADYYWTHNQYDEPWLDRRIAGAKQTAGNYNPNLPPSDFQNNPATSAYAAALATALTAYKTYKFP